MSFDYPVCLEDICHITHDPEICTRLPDEMQLCLYKGHVYKQIKLYVDARCVSVLWRRFTFAVAYEKMIAAKQEEVAIL